MWPVYRACLAVAITRWHLGHDDIHLNFGQERHFHLYAAIVFRGALLHAAAQHIGYRHAVDADLLHRRLESFKLTLPRDDGDLGNAVGARRSGRLGACFPRQ